MSINPIRVTVWNEYLHERTQADVAAIYPDGIHEALAAPLRAAESPDLPGLYPAATLAIFRILQEAVNNAMRHSGSKVVEVASGRSPLPGHRARLVVRDFGAGGAIAGRVGHGMDSMRRRARALGAALEIESDEQGTRVTLDLPERLDATSG